jgi:hypothetical protein
MILFAIFIPLCSLASKRQTSERERAGEERGEITPARMRR